MSQPPLFTLAPVIKKIEESESILRNIYDKVKSGQDVIIEKGLFSYAVAQIEILISDILHVQLSSFPDKLQIKECKVPKEDMLNSNEDIVDTIVSKQIQSLAYKSLREYMDSMYKYISIKPTLEDEIDTLQEIKATRNLLLHNNLKINSAYKENAGPKERSERYNKILPLDKEYILESIECIQRIIGDIKRKYKHKYRKYTRIYVLQELWKYVFRSPILKFEDVWIINNDSLVFKQTERAFRARLKNSYSSTECLFLHLWISHFSTSKAMKCFRNIPINTYRLDRTMARKYLFLQKAILNNKELFIF